MQLIFGALFAFWQAFSDFGNGKAVYSHRLRNRWLGDLYVVALREIYEGKLAELEIKPERADYPARENVAYMFDRLLGLNVFPITVPRKMAEHRASGSMQLFIDDSLSSSDHRKQFTIIGGGG